LTPFDIATRRRLSEFCWMPRFRILRSISFRLHWQSAIAARGWSCLGRHRLCASLSFFPLNPAGATLLLILVMVSPRAPEFAARPKPGSRADECRHRRRSVRLVQPSLRPVLRCDGVPPATLVRSTLRDSAGGHPSGQRVGTPLLRSLS